MSDFRSEIGRRIAQTRAQLADAAAGGDDHLVEISLGQLETLARIAVDHGLPADGAEESLATYGLQTPAEGLPRLA